MSEFTELMINTNPLLSNMTKVVTGPALDNYETSAGIPTKRHYRYNGKYTLSHFDDFQGLMNIAISEFLRVTSIKLTKELINAHSHIVIDDPVATNITKSQYYQGDLILIMSPEHSRRVMCNSDLAVFDINSHVPTYLGVPFTDSPDIERVIGFNKRLSCVVNLDVSVSYDRDYHDKDNKTYNLIADIRGLFLMVNISGQTA